LSAEGRRAKRRKLAYVHVPDTAVGGYLNFNRFYFAQVGKHGAVIDERYNPRRRSADYIYRHAEAPVAELRDFPRRRSVLLAAGANLWSENDDHQRNVRIGRRCAAVDVQAG